MTKPKFNESEKRAIQRHLQWCIECFETNLQAYKDLPQTTKAKFVQGQIRYWKNGLGAYRWSLKMLQAFGKGSHHAVKDNFSTIEGRFIEGGREISGEADLSESPDNNS